MEYEQRMLGQGTMSSKKKKYDFDVALSFAGAERGVAERIAVSFKSAGLSVFYDKDHFARLWGKRESEFEQIYSTRSRYVVPILSEHYRCQDWCRHELAVAKREAKQREAEFILPIRLDDTLILGIPDGIIYASLNRQSIAEITNAMVTKLGKASTETRSSKAAGRQRKQDRVPPRVLPPSRHRILGIIAVSPLPFTVEDFPKLFPDIDWRAEVAYLSRTGHVAVKEGRVVVPARVRRSLLPGDDDQRPFLTCWIDVLEPLKWHPDTALFLSIQLLQAGRVAEAVEVLTDVAETLEPGRWNETYCSTLLHVQDRRVQRRLSAQQRVRWLNAVGLCFTRKGEQREAVKWFLRLRKYSKGVDDQWGIGQSYINCGVAYTRLNEATRAEHCYGTAVDHARGTNDDHLLGRSLHNLAMTIMLRSADAARCLLDESAAAKKVAKDRQGRSGLYAGRGLVEAHAGNPRLALRWFQKAERAAKSLDNPWSLCNALCNGGSAYFELGEYGDALHKYLEARKIAEREGFLEVAPESLQGEAMAREKLGQHKRAEASFRRLHDVLKKRREWDGAVCAFNAVGVMLLRQKKATEARRVFRSACTLARRKDLPEWVCKCLTDQAVSYLEVDKDEQKAVKWLRSAAAKEEDHGLHGIAAHLWEEYARLLVGHDGRPTEIDHSFNKALACLRQAGSEPEAELELLGDLHAWRWDSQDYTAAIDALRELERRAGEHRHKEWQCRALDQRGACLQELERYAEAEKAHRKALAMARRLDGTQWVEHCLNNLGELLRKTNRPEGAIDCYVEAEALAETRKDDESAISVAHNRSLVLVDQGDFDEAARVLRWCRDVARKCGIQGQYVRALHGLANLAWVEKERRTAVRRYAKALAEAKRRGVSEQLCPISLNYANALRHGRDPEAAIRVLTPVQESFAKLADAQNYLIELASLYQEIGDAERAEPCWRTAFGHALVVGDRDAIATSAGGLAELCKEDGRLQQADKYLQTALAYEVEPQLRMVLLLQRLEVLVGMKKEKAASMAFEEVQALAQQHDLTDDLVNGCLIIGDYNWEEGKSKREATKAYAAALSCASGLDGVRIVEVCVHIAAQLASVGGKRPLYRIRQLGKQVTSWLVQDQGAKEGDLTIWYVLWPFRIAERVVAEYGDPDKVPEEVLADIVAGEASPP